MISKNYIYPISAGEWVNFKIELGVIKHKKRFISPPKLKDGRYNKLEEKFGSSNLLRIDSLDENVFDDHCFSGDDNAVIGKHR